MFTVAFPKENINSMKAELLVSFTAINLVHKTVSGAYLKTAQIMSECLRHRICIFINTSGNVTIFMC